LQITQHEREGARFSLVPNLGSRQAVIDVEVYHVPVHELASFVQSGGVSLDSHRVWSGRLSCAVVDSIDQIITPSDASPSTTQILEYTSPMLVRDTDDVIKLSVLGFAPCR